MGYSQKFVIPGVLEKAYEVEREIIENLENQGFDDNALFCIRLAMDEALINAIKHGNAENPELCLKIDCDADDQRVEISIEDEGEGFDHQNLADPTQGEYLRRTHGRGVYLIRQFMHEVRFNAKGNRITFCYSKELPSTGEFPGLRWERQGTILILSIEDVPGFPPVEQWENQVRRFVSDGQRKILIDLSGATFINTTILSFLVMVAQTLRGVGGECRICQAQEAVVRVLKTTNLHRLIPLHSNLELALEAMGEEQTPTI